MDFNMINSIFSTTENIFNIYNMMLDKELENKKDSREYKELCLRLQRILEFENDLYANLRTTKNDYIDYIKYLEDNHFDDDVIERIKHRLEKKYCLTFGINYDNSFEDLNEVINKDENNISSKILYALEHDICNIALDNVNKHCDYIDKEDKLYIKYSILYNFGLVDNELIDNNFTIRDNPLLISDQLFTNFGNCNDIYQFLKYSYLNQNISEYINNILLLSCDEENFEYEFNYNLVMLKSFISLDSKVNIDKIIKTIKNNDNYIDNYVSRRVIEEIQSHENSILEYNCDNLNDLYLTLDDIKQNYEYMFSLEIANRKNAEFTFLKDDNINKIKIENNILNKMKDKEIEYYLTLLFSEYMPLDNNPVISRMISRLEKTLRYRKCKVDCVYSFNNEIDIKKLEECINQKLYRDNKYEDTFFRDLYMLYLKFLEEYKDINQLGESLFIEDNGSINYFITRIKYELCYEKYEIEEELLNNNLETNKDVYLMSDFIGNILGLDNTNNIKCNIISPSLKEVIINILDINNDSYANNVESIYNIISFLSFARSYLIFVPSEEIDLLYQELEINCDDDPKISYNLLLDVLENTDSDKKIPYKVNYRRKTI